MALHLINQSINVGLGMCCKMNKTVNYLPEFLSCTIAHKYEFMSFFVPCFWESCAVSSFPKLFKNLCLKIVKSLQKLICAQQNIAKLYGAKLGQTNIIYITPPREILETNHYPLPPSPWLDFVLSVEQRTTN